MYTRVHLSSIQVVPNANKYLLCTLPGTRKQFHSFGGGGTNLQEWQQIETPYEHAIITWTLDLKYCVPTQRTHAWKLAQCTHAHV